MRVEVLGIDVHDPTTGAHPSSVRLSVTQRGPLGMKVIVDSASRWQARRS